MSNFALANVVWLFCGFVVLLFVCTNLLFKSNNETPSKRTQTTKKNCNKWIIDKPP